MITKKMFLAATAIVVLAGCKQTETKQEVAKPTGKEAKWDAVVQDSYPSWQAPKKSATQQELNTPAIQAVPAEPIIETSTTPQPVKPVVVQAAQPEPAPKQAVVAPKKIETANPNSDLKAQLDRSENGVYYTIKLGDSFWKLSKSFYGTGMKWQTISKANAGNYKSPTKLVIGKKLFIPKLPNKI